MAVSDSEQQFCVRLVQAVEKHECLYNYNMTDYCRKDIVDNTWKAIANELNAEVGKCKEKWRNIRTVFLRHIKGGPNGTKRKRTYYLNSNLQFLVPFIKLSTVDNSLCTSSFPQEIKSMDFDADESEGDIKPQITESWSEARNKKTTVEEEDESQFEFHDCGNSQEFDSRKLFLLSLLPDLHLMNSQQTRTFKRRVLALIDDILETK